ncbi:hypothetical protein RJ55_01970 [Drechmeria coniospora]|nr:hypothetical protein RJ55_01970 [Drechmeria coniospora]
MNVPQHRPPSILTKGVRTACMSTNLPLVLANLAGSSERRMPPGFWRNAFIVRELGRPLIFIIRRLRP